MTVENSWDARVLGRSGDTGAVVSRPRLGFVDLILQLWRTKWLMMLITLLIFLPFLLLALMLPTKYAANAGLMVSLGEEQVYRPLVGSEAAGAIPDQELINEAEIELLSSPVVAERVIEKFSLQTLYPKIAENPKGEPPARLLQMGVKELLDEFGAGANPKSNVVRVTFRHEDPILSAEILNAMIAEYLKYRSEVYLSTRSTSFAEQRLRFENDLAQVEEDIRWFLDENKIGDFDAEFQAAQAQFATVSEQALRVDSDATAVDGRLMTLARQMRQTAPLVDIFVEDSTDQTLLNLKVEREEALSRYKPDSRTVQAIDRRIEQVEAYLAEQNGAIGTRRTGPNPIYQDMEQRRSGLEAESRSLANQSTELARQKAQLSARLRLFNNIRAEWQELLRRRDLVERSLSNFAEREVASIALAEIAKQEADNVRITEPARPPLEGSSLAKPVAALGLLFAMFTALMVGLFRAATRRNFSTASSVERTTGMPVIASVKRR